jgi:hypothetical protein
MNVNGLTLIVVAVFAIGLGLLLQAVAGWISHRPALR